MAPRDVRLDARFDDGPGETRIGVILFDEDVTTEAALAGLRPEGEAVAIHVSRMPVPIDHTPAGLAKTGEDIAAAARLLPSGRIDVVAYACTTGAIEFGRAALSAHVARGRPGVPVATPIAGALGAFAALGVRRISLLTPYNAALNRLIVELLEGCGVEVLVCATFAIEDEARYANVSLDSVRKAAVQAMAPEAEALFIACMALRGTEIVAELEAALGGRPVVTSAQALLWDAARLAGRPIRREGAGRLFSL